MRVLSGVISKLPHSHLSGYTEAGIVQWNVWTWNDLDLPPPPFEPSGVGTNRYQPCVFYFLSLTELLKTLLLRSFVPLRKKSKVLAMDRRALHALASTPLQPHCSQQPRCHAVNMPTGLLPQGLPTLCSLCLTVTRFSH